MMKMKGKQEGPLERSFYLDLMLLHQRAAQEEDV
jgi:hypothetical protein